MKKDRFEMTKAAQCLLTQNRKYIRGVPKNLFVAPGVSQRVRPQNNKRARPSR